MFKIIGAAVIMAASAGLGFSMSENLKRRITAVNSLVGFVEFISSDIMLFRTPLDTIYESVSDEFLIKSGFRDRLGSGVYTAAWESGLLMGNEEREIIKDFSDKIGGGSVDDMVKLCTYTSSRLKSVSDRLNRDLPDKRRVYHTVSILTGASAVIILL